MDQFLFFMENYHALVSMGCFDCIVLCFVFLWCMELFFAYSLGIDGEINTDILWALVVILLAFCCAEYGCLI